MFRLFERLIEFAFWLRIFISPMLIFAIIAFVVHVISPGDDVHPLSVVLLILGVITSTLFANKMTKDKAPSEFMSAVNATPELDNKKKKKRIRKKGGNW